MNYVTLTATVINDPAEVELRNNSYTSLDIEIAAPQYGNYAPTQLEFKVWGNAQNQIISKTETEKKLLITKGSKILIENAELFFTYNKETKIQGKENNVGLGFETKARGGPIEQGKPYVVGEEGPEIIIPRSDGNVLSNDDSQIYAMLLASNPQLQKVSRQRAEKILRNRFPEYFEG